MGVSSIVRLVLTVLCVLLFGYGAMHSHVFLEKMAKSRSLFASIYYKIFGGAVRQMHLNFTRRANLNKQSKLYKCYEYFNDMIVNLDMAKDNVTVTGLLIFMSSVSLSLSIVVCSFMGAMGLLVPLALAFFYLTTTIFRLMALLRYEKREAEIMDVVDLLVSDVNGGIYNAILRYQESFPPNIKPYFLIFLDDISNKGYSFKDAMVRLNDALGVNFTDFAQKAILYEEKADNSMDDIFSVIIERNRQRRTLRYTNNLYFAALRTQFLVSVCLIIGYCAFTALTEPFILKFLFGTLFGKIMIIGDVVLIAWVISYLAVIKAKLL